MKLDVVGFDSVQAQMDKLDAAVRRGAIKDVLSAGAQVYADSWNETISAKGHVGNGTRNSAHLKDSARVVKIEESAGGKVIAEVGPDGYDSRGVAQDLKANVINKRYDKKLKKAAETAAKPIAEAAMQQRLNELTGG